ncbi:MAG: hypothetical protein JRN15_20610, partial [Nitrososphaerota archaeon]|nr:hypothetical protein [Nitrososphaerota archaeon]
TFIWTDIEGNGYASLGNNLTTSGISFDTQTLLQRLTLSATLSIPLGIYVRAYVFWYNSTSPASFYGYFSSESFGPLLSGFHSISFVVSPPLNASLTRLVFWCYPTNKSSYGTTFLSAPSFERTVYSSSNLGYLSALQTNLKKDLLDSGLLSQGAYVIPLPYSQFVLDNNVSGLQEIVSYPASTLDPEFANVLNIDLRSLIPHISDASGNVTMFITGTLSINKAMTVTSTTLQKSVSVDKAGSFLLSFDIPLSSFLRLSFNFTGSALVSTIGFICTLNGSQNSLIVPMPLGSLTLSRTGSNNYTVTRIYIGSGPGSGLGSDGLRYVPLVVLATATIIVLMPIWPIKLEQVIKSALAFFARKRR